MPEKVVVDCSVAAKWVLPEPGRLRAMQLLEQQESGEISLIAPDLILAEFGSLIAKRARRKELFAGHAPRAYQLFEQCAPRLFDMRTLLAVALDLALRHQMSLRNCVYLALALEHDCPFVTADQRLFQGGSARHSIISLLD